MYVSVQQMRVVLLAIGLIAALVLALDLARVATGKQSASTPNAYVGTARNTPGSTAHLRIAYRATLAARTATS